MTVPVSVVMASYNGERYLRPQLDSVLGQLLPVDELIVVDDASTDGSAAWLASVEDPRIRLHRNPTNLGVRLTFERGFALARHEIVFLCDQDDVWLTGKRTAFVTAFERDPQTLVVISDAQIVDADGNIVAPSFMATRGGFRGGWISTLVRNRYLGCAMALRRPLLAAALPIPARVPMHDMWLGALGSLLGRVQYLPTPLLQYRRHGGNVTPSRRQSVLRMLLWRVSLLHALVARLAAVRSGHDGLAAMTAAGRATLDR